ncbi:unnamed protein product, partial [Discosporangium mesarthrocarpum]
NLARHLTCHNPPLREPPAEFYLGPECANMCSTCLSEQNRDTDICCLHCNRLYHSTCLDIVPDPDDFHWMCPACLENEDLKVSAILHCRLHQAMGAEERLRRINGWRAKKGLHPLERARQVPLEGKEYFVRWEGKGYWHCSWLSPYRVQQLCPSKLNNFIKRTLNQPTAYPTSVDKVLVNEHAPKCTVPHRIIAEKNICMDGINNLSVYLVKWRGLDYDDCTWEMEGELVKYPHVIQSFHERKKGPWRQMYANLKPPEGWDGTTVLPKPTRFELLKEQPYGLALGPMYPYQLEGLNFLRQSWWADTNVILADEMGMGKTIQSIAFICTILLERPPTMHKPCLVIAPLSTTHNWERELELWCPDLNVVRFVGATRARSVIAEYDLFVPRDNVWGPGVTNGKGKNKPLGPADANGVPNFHVMIAHYEILTMCSSFLKGIEWELLVVDEAHRLKGGVTSKSFQLASSLNTNHRLLLTGTPLQNNVDELFNLLQFIEPKKFSNRNVFLEQFTNLKMEGQVAGLQLLLKPHMLRRTKKDVPELEIPDKHELVVPVELSHEQKEVYRAILTKNMEVLRKGDAKRSYSARGLQNIVMELKKTCNHPYLCRPRPGASIDDLIKAASKLTLLDKMLKKLYLSGNRVLVFSQMTAMLDILQDYAVDRKFGFRRIDGDTVSVDRQRYIDEFNNSISSGNKDIFLFFLSTKAGGQGINLATADTVVIYDSDWNPHNDLQALARAHRIGQVNKVMIYRFVSRCTVEERIMEVAKKKLLLEHVVVQDGKGTSMSQEQLNLVIKYGAEDLFSDDRDDGEDSQDKQLPKEDNRNVAKFGDGSAGNRRKISQWTESAVDQLLDRSSVEETE